MLTKNILEHIYFFARAYPMLLLMSISISFLFNHDIENLYLLAFLIFGESLNNILKNYIFKPIMKNKKFPILGLGKRPFGAKKCGISNISRKNEGYGMPSGHSQIATMFSTYVFLKTENDILEQTTKYIIQSILILLALFIMYSRIHLNCHTIQQVLMGGSIGIFLGYYVYYFRENII